MRALFVYKYLTLGGVESVLSARVAGLPPYGVEARAWFLSDGPGRELFREFPQDCLVGSPADLAQYCEGFTPDILTTIDTEEIFPIVGQIPGRTRLVIESHSPYRENRVYLRWLARLPVAAFWVPSEYQAALIRPRMARLAPVRVIPNALQSSFVQTPRPFQPLPPLPVVLWVGRLDRVKHWDLFLDIAERVSRTRPGVEWWVVGQPDRFGTDRDFFRAAVARNLTTKVRWIDSVASQHMPRLYDLTRESGGLVISTSRHESFGLAVAEAMARACPVVAPDQGPFPEFIRDGTDGRLYRPGSAGDAAAKVLSLLGDPTTARQLGSAARTRVLASYAPEAALPALVEALEAAAAVENLPQAR